MKTNNTCYIATILTLCMTVLGGNYASARLVAYDPGTMVYPVTMTQAQQSAKDWAGNQALQFTIKGVDVPRDTSQAQLGTSYVLDSSDGLQRFMVDCYSGQVCKWRDKAPDDAYQAKLPDIQDLSERLPVSELSATVCQFLGSKYPNWANLNMQQPDQTSPRSPYYQRLANGVWYPRNAASAGIDDWNGQIVSYSASSGGPPSISTQYSVTSTQAEQAALAYEQGQMIGNTLPQSAFVWRNRGVWVDIGDNNSERLVWQIDIVVDTEAGLTYTQYQQDPHAGRGSQITVIADANTGSIIRATPAQTDPLPMDVQSAATPTFSPDGGTHTGAQTVTIACTTNGSTIRYTTDGTTPTANSTVYTGPISIASSKTLKARAWCAEYRCSVVKSATYTIQ